ncbi:MAG: endonuclease/exonuclease/phosphatase family protein [Planctomycetes bacterium]|nr:endonuclease/exonuclease/phosphatase family protein [Planctomycetota bacterium]
MAAPDEVADVTAPPGGFRTARRLRMMVLVAAAPLLAWIAVSLTASWFWAGELASHWTLHAAVLLVPVAILLRRDRLPGGVVMLAIVLGALPQFRAAWQARAPLPGAESRTLTVTHANIYYRNRTVATQLPAVARCTDDLLVLVESGPEDEASLRGDPRWPHQQWSYGKPLDDGTISGVALCSRLPLAGVELRRDEDLPVIDARVAQGGRVLRIVVVHPKSPQLPSRQRMRDRGLASIARSVAGSLAPVIVIGDINCSPASPAWHRLCAEGSLRPAAGPLPATWPSWFGPAGIAIDHVLAGGGAAIGDLRAFPVQGSDHRGISARIGF